jgi:purine-binding chemotaxis protein CheW
MSLADQATEAPQVDEITTYLVFTIGEEFYTVKTENVVEIFDDFPLTPLPTTAEWFLGVGNFHGEIVPVIDIRNLNKNLPKSEIKRAILLRSLKRKNFEVAIIVDSICEISTIGNFNQVNNNSFLVAESLYKQKRLYLIDVEELINQILIGLAR